MYILEASTSLLELTDIDKLKLAQSYLFLNTSFLFFNYVMTFKLQKKVVDF